MRAMKKLLAVIIVIAVVLGVHFLIAGRSAQSAGRARVIKRVEGVPPDIPDDKLMVWQQQIECQWATEPADMSIQIRLDPDDGKNRIYFELAEAHGFYLDTCNLVFWYTDGDNATGIGSSPIVVRHVLNDYVEAGRRLRSCIDVSGAELERVGGDMGQTDNWRATINACHRACEGNPTYFPMVTTAVRCG